MKFMNDVIFMLISFVSSCWGAQTWKSYPRSTWDFELDTRYYQTTANYLTEGFYFETLPSGQGFKQILVNTNVRYHFAKPWALFVDSQTAYSESKNLRDTRTNSGFTQSKAGVDFVLYNGGYAIMPELTLLYPFTRNSINSDATAMNEGAMEAGGRMILQSRFSKFRWATYGGFLYRDEGRSSLIPYGLMLEFQFRRFVLGNELQGYRSIGLDRDSTNTSARTTWANQVNGGSQRYFAINPSLLENHTWFRFVLNKSFYMQIGGSFSVTGSNTAAGWGLFGGILYRLRPNLPTTTNRIERFQPELNENLDQNFFEESTAPELQKRS